MTDFRLNWIKPAKIIINSLALTDLHSTRHDDAKNENFSASEWDGVEPDMEVFYFPIDFPIFHTGKQNQTPDEPFRSIRPSHDQQFMRRWGISHQMATWQA